MRDVITPRIRTNARVYSHCIAAACILLRDLCVLRHGELAFDSRSPRLFRAVRHDSSGCSLLGRPKPVASVAVDRMLESCCVSGSLATATCLSPGRRATLG